MQDGERCDFKARNAQRAKKSGGCTHRIAPSFVDKIRSTKVRAGDSKVRVSTGSKLALLGLSFLMASVSAFTVELGKYRLLSVSTSAKMILISQIPNKTKFVLDASTAKVTLDGKPAEFQTLQSYSIVHVKFEQRKGSKDGIDIDGVASEISISTPENPPK
jgi:hypothetical protein